jgi:hypothetical protein
MSTANASAKPSAWSVEELRRMPPLQRDSILAAAADAAALEYEQDALLTDFEAFGAEDLHGESGDAQTR